MQRLISLIQDNTRETSSVTGVDKIRPDILQAMNKIDRADFVLARDKNYAYENRPLSIGHGQTISQPFIVALMLEFLELKKSDIILEIGSGSGYVCALLSQLANYVFGIECVQDLYSRSQKIIAKKKLTNINLICGDGTKIIEQYGPFDKILVSAAAQNITPAFLEQLKISGRLVIPVQAGTDYQVLKLLIKKSNSDFIIRDIINVRFVPLVNS